MVHTGGNAGSPVLRAHPRPEHRAVDKSTGTSRTSRCVARRLLQPVPPKDRLPRRRHGRAESDLGRDGTGRPATARRLDMVGWPMQGQLYISQGVRSAQAAGHLWLSEVLGAELIIESYNAVTFLIGAGEGKPVGTALVLDRTHMVTNRHVIEGLVGPVPEGR